MNCRACTSATDSFSMNPFDLLGGWFQNLSEGSEADCVNGTRPERRPGKSDSTSEKRAMTAASPLDMPPSLRKKVGWEPCGLEPFTGLPLGTKFGERAEHECRTEAEVEELVQHWKRYVHPRAREFCNLDEVLANIASQLPRGEDPVTGPGTSCVFWRGDTELNEAGVYESVTTVDWIHGRKQVFTNRLLVFLFATTESMNFLMTLPKRPFLMGCQHQLCLNLAHLDMDGARLRVCSPDVRVQRELSDKERELLELANMHADMYANMQRYVAALGGALQGEEGAQMD